MTKEIVDRRYQKCRTEPYAPHGTLIPDQDQVWDIHYFTSTPLFWCTVTYFVC